MTTVQLPVKISGTVLTDPGFRKQKQNAQLRLQLHQEIHSPEVLLQVILTNKAMALQIIVGPRGAIIS